MTISKKIFPWFIAITGSLAALILLAFAIIYWFLQRDPQELSQKYLHEIAERAHLAISFQGIDVTLLPVPAIALSEVSVTGEGLDIRIPWLGMRPGLMQILHGNFFPASIRLLRPKITFHLPCALGNVSGLEDYASQIKNKISAEKSGEAKFSAGNCSIGIFQGQVEIAAKDSESISLNNVECDLQTEHTGYIGGTVNIPTLIMRKGGGNVFGLEGAALKGLFRLDNPLDKKNQLDFSARIYSPELIHKADLKILFSGQENGWQGNGSFSGQLLLAGVPVNFEISGNAGKTGANPINLHSLAFLLDRDHGRFNGNLALPGPDSAFQLDGALEIARLSLTQWLGFARNLTPGLQISLDNIFNASLKFQLTSQYLKVGEISAICNGSRFTGTGGVADFSKPLVALDLTTDKTNLGLGLPESLAKSPIPPKFPYPPLTPMPGTPIKPGETGIAYDIRLGAKKLIYGPLTIDNGRLRIYPGKMDKIGLEDVLLDGEGGFYGGAVSGSCILGAHKEMPLNIVLKASNINASALAKDLDLLPVAKGKLGASLNVFSKGKKLDPFLANLHGAIAVTGANVVLKNMDENFPQLDGKVNLKKALLEKSVLYFDGDWTLGGKTSAFDGLIEASGRVGFYEKGVSLKNLPTKFKLTTLDSKNFFKAKTVFSGNAESGFNNGKLEFLNASLNFLDVKTKGSLKIDLDKFSISGDLDSRISNVGDLLAKMGYAAFKIPPGFSSLHLKSEFAGQPKQLKLQKINAGFKGVTLQGNLSMQTKSERPQLEFSLNANEVDEKELFGANTVKKNKTSTPLNFEFMKEFEAKGDVKIKKVKAYDITLTSLDTPVQLESGKLTIGPATARFYGAPFQSRCFFDFNKGLSINTIVATHGFDLGQAAADRKIEGALNGHVNLDINLNAHLTKTGQLPGALNGSWSFSVQNGSWQARKDGRLEGKPTIFTSAQASGKMHSGVLESSNFKMRGPDMSISGGGLMNLANERIDCNFNVNMKGLPEFPLRLYGTISDSKTSIGAGKMMLNAIGGITSGFMNIVGGIVEGTWKMFQ